ncbi:MAG: preprotein translocase subunit TatB [Paracoccus denitrificans]|nr:MAG: preprotein translocase subunit TatB [Paracoccus denitrificans]PZO85455.1 MAG: preprotein translocase subunit TatB [Paracoccus denitrificans]
MGVPLTIDARHLLCPLPVLKLQKALRSVDPGTVVQLIATDPAAVIDVPHFCDAGGHLLQQTAPNDGQGHVFTVIKGAGHAPSRTHAADIS